MSTRTFLSLKKLACRSATALFPSKAARPVLAPMNRWSWISRPPLPSKSLAPKSVEGFSSMWHSLQFDLATSG